MSGPTVSGQSKLLGGRLRIRAAASARQGVIELHGGHKRFLRGPEDQVQMIWMRCCFYNGPTRKVPPPVLPGAEYTAPQAGPRNRPASRSVHQERGRGQYQLLCLFGARTHRLRQDQSPAVVPLRSRSLQFALNGSQGWGRTRRGAVTSFEIKRGAKWQV